jgi:predicted enzyme related to lactoylglutathione lyase
MTTISRTSFVIAVHDLQASATFYRDILGFTVREISDPGWLFFERDVCTIMAGECRDSMPAGETQDHSYFAYLVVSEIDAFYAQVANKGAEIVKPLRDEAWGMREFGLRTIDGHRIMIASAVNPEGAAS